MGLFAFNRMRLKRVEEMIPKNIDSEASNKPATIIDDVSNDEIAKEEVIEEVKVESTKRGSSRKK